MHRLSHNMFKRCDFSYSYIGQVVYDFSNVLFDLMYTNASSAGCSTAVEHTNNHNLHVFIKRFVWNVLYYANILYSPPGDGLYDWFSKKIPCHRIIAVNDMSFDDSPEPDHNLRFLIDCNRASGHLKTVIDETLERLFYPFSDVYLDDDLFIRATRHSAGVDYVFSKSVTLKPNTVLNFHVDGIPKSMYRNFYVQTRSSSFMSGIECWPGPEVRGRPTINLINNDDKEYTIPAGGRVYQYVFKPEGPLISISMKPNTIKGSATYENGYFVYTYHGPDYMNDEKSLFIVDTGCFIDSILSDVCVYIKIISCLSDITVYEGIIDSDYKNEIKILCKLSPGSVLKTGTKIAHFKMFEYINVKCNVKSETRSGGMGSSNFV